MLNFYLFLFFKDMNCTVLLPTSGIPGDSRRFQVDNVH